jgi:hypothetical protein
MLPGISVLDVQVLETSNVIAYINFCCVVLEILCFSERIVLCFRSRLCARDKPHVFVTCSFAVDPLLGQVKKLLSSFMLCIGELHWWCCR